MARDLDTINIPKIIDGRRKHPTYWFDDGSLVLCTEQCAFQVHRSLLYRLSRALPNWSAEGSKHGGISVVVIRGGLVRPEDVENLLEHIYHDNVLASTTPFPRVASILRVSSPTQLDFPSVHQLARQYMISMFPSGPAPFFHPDHLEEALSLATEFQIPTIQKGLLYSLVTTSNFVTDEDGASSESPLPSDKTQPGPSDNGVPQEPAPSIVLSVTDARRCTRLMTQIMEHFTPILFTVATTSHRECTDVLADTWMPLVIQPALENDGVYKPLETLQRMIDLDWAAHGMCAPCILEKREEWRNEQEDIWERIDGWLGLGDPQ